jgi:hypothetical protein
MDADRTRALTYTEMASTMAITVASAKNLTRRKRWPRTKTNEGLVRVLVPLDYLEGNGAGEGRDGGRHASSHEGLAEGRQDALGTIAALERHVARLEASLAAVQKALAEARTEVDEARARALAEAITKAAMTATLEAVTDERDRLLTREHLREQRPWWRRLAG